MRTLTKKQEKREMELKNALALARISDIAISEAYLVLDAFRRAEKQLQTLAEHSCNGYPKEVTEYRDGKVFRYNVENTEWRERCEKLELKVEKRVCDMAVKHHLTVEFQGDPRGMMFSLKAPSGQAITF